MLRNEYLDFAARTARVEPPGFAHQAVREGVGAGLPIETGVRIVVRVDAHPRDRIRNPELLHVPAAQGGPDRFARAQVHGQCGLEPFRDREFIGGLEEPDGGTVDAGRQDLAGLRAQGLATVPEVGAPCTAASIAG